MKTQGYRLNSCVSAACCMLPWSLGQALGLVTAVGIWCILGYGSVVVRDLSEIIRKEYGSVLQKDTWKCLTMGRVWSSIDCGLKSCHGFILQEVS